MRNLSKLLAGCAAVGVFLVAALARQDDKPRVEPPPVLKFDEVAEIAPGVFFRYSSISATDKTVPFGGSNNIWVVFKDYVVVIDANFPKEAADVLAAVKKTTDKPIKYVFDTHHHGDHAYGNAVWAKAGAKVLASSKTARLLKVNGPKQWEEQAKGRKDLRENTLKEADESFDEKLVLDDGTQRVEFLHLGHAHTIGDAVAYLPKHRILCTGDACVNGAFNFMGHSNSASWIACLEKMEKLDVKYVCPGHGPVATRDLLGRQKRYFAEMRAHVQKGIDAGQDLAAITASLDLPWYTEWTGKAAKDIPDNVGHVYKELTGKIDHDRLGMAPGDQGWPYAGRADRLAGR
ncbi:MAG TPA: MBL fold metallo-hydrolase [Gemmataceae bacterium]|nr:MBL fold metallo-hydrolase [Gemmataceae bacterium]